MPGLIDAHWQSMLIGQTQLDAMTSGPAFGLINHAGIRATIEQVVGPDGQLR